MKNKKFVFLFISYNPFSAEVLQIVGLIQKKLPSEKNAKTFGKKKIKTLSKKYKKLLRKLFNGKWKIF